MTTILIVLAGMLLFSFLLQRPLKKQAEEQARLRDALAEGSRVLLTSNIFGTITHVGDEQVIVEIAPGVEVTATKQAVIKLVTPDEEEFEFDDEAPASLDDATGAVPDDEVTTADGTPALEKPFAGPQTSVAEPEGSSAQPHPRNN
ncbi:preprotein translocase subunit YajC [Luteococcus sp. Sow4_B9]|uniref:preprotein translocase subunit YajC n=1 Tax=Luteococcus sp. Sow4_B9 TaxID=3438792 RepID=UPI003F94EB50